MDVRPKPGRQQSKGVQELTSATEGLVVIAARKVHCTVDTTLMGASRALASLWLSGRRERLFLLCYEAMGLLLEHPAHSPPSSGLQREKGFLAKLGWPLLLLCARGRITQSKRSSPYASSPSVWIVRNQKILCYKTQ